MNLQLESSASEGTAAERFRELGYQSPSLDPSGNIWLAHD